MSNDRDVLEAHLKKVMGHRRPAPVCGRCQHFVDTDCSGDINALPSHCTLSPVVKLPVKSDDVCKHFENRTDKR